MFKFRVDKFIWSEDFPEQDLDLIDKVKELGFEVLDIAILDCFHMIREELSFDGAVKVCGKEYLGYVHVCESNRGIPGTGLVPWREFFSSLKEIDYKGPLVI